MATQEPSSSFVFRPRSLARKLYHNTLHLPVPTKALILLLIVVLGSVLCAVDLSPDTHFADPKNPINVYLVKLCWGWTLLVVAPITFFSSVLYSGLQRKTILQHLGRLAVSHAIWMTVTSLIVLLDSSVGVCAVDDITDRSVCIKNGHVWTGFDISGHVFLLTYCIYVITEESANIKLEVWYEYPNTIAQENHVTDKLTEREKNGLPMLHKMASWIVEPLEFLSLALVLVWTVMIAATSLYFHSFVEKVLGFACGYVAWYLTYKCLYGKHPYVPCRPDEGLLHPNRHT